MMERHAAINFTFGIDDRRQRFRCKKIVKRFLTWNYARKVLQVFKKFLAAKSF